MQKSKRVSLFFFTQGNRVSLLATWGKKLGIISCSSWEKKKEKKLTFVDVSFDNYYCFANNLNCSIFVFLLGVQCYHKFGDLYKIFYSNREKKLVFSYNLIYFCPALLTSFYYLARKYKLICLVLSLHGRGFQKRWEGGGNKEVKGHISLRKWTWLWCMSKDIYKLCPYLRTEIGRTHLEKPRKSFTGI